MIGFEFSKLKQIISTIQYFYAEVYGKLHAKIFLSILWIYQEQMKGSSNIKNWKILHIPSLYYMH